MGDAAHGRSQSVCSLTLRRARAGVVPALSEQRTYEAMYPGDRIVNCSLVRGRPLSYGPSDVCRYLGAGTVADGVTSQCYRCRHDRLADS